MGFEGSLSSVGLGGFVIHGTLGGCCSIGFGGSGLRWHGIFTGLEMIAATKEILLVLLPRLGGCHIWNWNWDAGFL